MMGDFKEWAELSLGGKWVAGVEYSGIQDIETRGCNWESGSPMRLLHLDAETTQDNVKT